MNEFEKSNERKGLERDSIKDDKQSQKISAQTIFIAILIIGIGLMIFAYTSGYFTTGSPGREGQKRLGPVSPDDSAMVNKSDTIIGN